MKARIAIAILALALAGPAEAKVWSGADLTVSGNTSNNCDLRVVEVTHSGRSIDPITVTVQSRLTSQARIYAEMKFTRGAVSYSGTMTGLVSAGQQTTMRGVRPPVGGADHSSALVDGSSVEVRFNLCSWPG
jgi:hypothetical protein